jgi:uncharacterized protein
MTAMEGIPAPIVNTLSAPHWQAAAEGRLLLPFCTATGRFFWPPSPISPYTAGPVAWREAEPVGMLVAKVIYERLFQQAFAGAMPYGVGLVALDVGPRLNAHMAEPSLFTPGERVRVGFAALVADGPKVPVLERITGA